MIAARIPKQEAVERRVLRVPWEPLLIFAATRIGLFAIAAAGQALVPRNPGRGHWSLFPGDYLLDGWARWDSGYYVSIAQSGYTMGPTNHDASVAFFPLYPLAIRLVGDVIGSFPLAGLLISNFAFAAALVVLYILAEQKLGQGVASRTLLFLCVFPYALYYSAVYTESLFLLLSVGSFSLAERDHWWLSGLLGMLSAATRIVGLTLGPALLLVYLQQRKFDVSRIRWNILSLGLIPVGTALFSAYLGARFGQPLAFLDSSLFGWTRYNVFQSGLGRLNPATIPIGDYDLVLGMNLFVAVVWLLLAIPTYRLLGPGYATFVVLGTIIPLSAGLDSLGRYVAVLFPAYVALGYYVHDRFATRLMIFGSAALLALLTVLFVNWYWII